MQKFFTLSDLNVKRKRVLVRVGMDMPIDKEGNITNDKRIIEGLPTIKYLLGHDAKQVIILNHMGRPKNKTDSNLNHDKLAKKLSQYLGVKVAKIDDCIDVKLPNEKTLLLENVRFHPEETENNEEFAKKLADLGDIFVNDAFSVSHREQASITGIPKFLQSCAGLLLEKELRVMGKAMENPDKPFVAILGGVKISDKIKVIENLLAKVDKMLIGGAMIFTFFKAQGKDIGTSKVENDCIDLAKKLLKNKKIMLPVDVVVADKFDANANSKVADIDGIEDGWIGLDIGPETIKSYKEILKNAKTIVWNGPMGVFEFDKFANGTREIAKFLSALKAVTIIGGGDSAAAVEKFGYADKLTHVSTGGGASLEFFEGKKLPGIAALEESYKRFR
ncbi:phosphoglycerate kinase [Candidatus Woesearchaeota archaeon]|nr:phosphoglycerate kinase [Candidatus Woesearchaeota archaeon]